MLAPYTNLDLHAMLDGVIARELGAVQSFTEEV